MRCQSISSGATGTLEDRPCPNGAILPASLPPLQLDSTPSPSPPCGPDKHDTHDKLLLHAVLPRQWADFVLLCFTNPRVQSLTIPLVLLWGVLDILSMFTDRLPTAVSVFICVSTLTAVQQILLLDLHLAKLLCYEFEVGIRLHVDVISSQPPPRHCSRSLTIQGDRPSSTAINLDNV